MNLYSLTTNGDRLSSYWVVASGPMKAVAILNAHLEENKLFGRYLHSLTVMSGPSEGTLLLERDLRRLETHG